MGQGPARAEARLRGLPLAMTTALEKHRAYPFWFALRSHPGPPMGAISAAEDATANQLLSTALLEVLSATIKRLSWSAHAATTTYPRRGLKQQEFVFSQFWRPEVGDKGLGKVDFFWDLSSCCCRQPSVPVSSHGRPSVSMSQFPLLLRTRVRLGQSPS